MTRMRTIDTVQLPNHVKDMINVLEYDSSRRPGKTKANAQLLISLIQLDEHYTKINNSKATTKKKTEVS